MAMSSEQQTTVEVEVTREELDVISEWLEDIMKGGDAEAEGRKSDDNHAARAAELLADFAEKNGDRGADIISVCRGVPVLVEVVLEAEAQRMMEALMGACAGVIPPRKVGALRVLVSMAKCERHRAGISGSGVLGVVTAAAVGVKTPTQLRALCFEAIGLWSSDDDMEMSTRYFDEKRAQEFVKLRKQVLAVKVVDAMVSCLEPSKAPHKVALCVAAADSIARLASSSDVAPVLVSTNVVNKCIQLLKSAHDAMQRQEEDVLEYEEEFDYSFAWEKPALRILIGILRHMSSVPFQPHEQGDGEGGGEGGLPVLCQQVADRDTLDTVLAVLKLGGGGRSLVERLAMDVLRRLTPLPLTYSNEDENEKNQATNEIELNKPNSDEVITIQEQDALDWLKTGGEYLLGESGKGSEMMTIFRRCIVMSDENTIIATLELLTALSNLSPTPKTESSTCRSSQEICKQWCESILTSGLIPGIARAVVSSRDHGVVLSSSSFSTHLQQARPINVLMAACLLFRSISISTNNLINTSAPQSVSMSTDQKAPLAPGDIESAAHQYFDYMVLCLTDPRPTVRADALMATVSLVHPSFQHSQIYSIFVAHLLHQLTSSSSSTTTSMIGGALRTIAASGDLTTNTREMANDLIAIIDSAVTCFSSAMKNNNNTSNNKNSKNSKNKKRNKNKNKNSLNIISEESSTSNQQLFLNKIFDNELNSLLLEMNDNKITKVNSSQEVVLSKANQLKVIGNDKFKQRLFKDATIFYESALTTLDSLTEEEDDDDDNAPADGDDDDDGEGDDDNGDDLVNVENASHASITNSKDYDNDYLKKEKEEELKELKEPRRNKMEIEVCALKVACYLNQARCYLRLWDEDRCLAACAYAEAAAYTEVFMSNVSFHYTFLFVKEKQSQI